MKKIVVTLLAAALLAGSGFTSAMAQPPENSKKLSELLAKVEARDKFLYVSEIEWSDSGYYDVIYYTSDKAKVELHLDALTGEPK